MSLSFGSRPAAESALDDPRVWREIREDIKRWIGRVREDGGTGQIVLNLNLRNGEYMGYRVGANGSERRSG